MNVKFIFNRKICGQIGVAIVSSLCLILAGFFLDKLENGSLENFAAEL